MRKKLRAARKRVGLTQAEVARRSGISRVHYTTIEAGQYNPSLEVALRIAAVLGESVEELFGPADFDFVGEGERAAAIKVAR